MRKGGWTGGNEKVEKGRKEEGAEEKKDDSGNGLVV